MMFGTSKRLSKVVKDLDFIIEKQTRTQQNYETSSYRKAPGRMHLLRKLRKT